MMWAELFGAAQRGDWSGGFSQTRKHSHTHNRKSRGQRMAKEKFGGLKPGKAESKAGGGNFKRWRPSASAGQLLDWRRDEKCLVLQLLQKDSPWQRRRWFPLAQLTQKLLCLSRKRCLTVAFTHTKGTHTNTHTVCDNTQEQHRHTHI